MEVVAEFPVQNLFFFFGTGLCGQLQNLFDGLAEPAAEVVVLGESGMTTEVKRGIIEQKVTGFCDADLSDVEGGKPFGFHSFVGPSQKAEKLEEELDIERFCTVSLDLEVGGQRDDVVRGAKEVGVGLEVAV